MTPSKPQIIQLQYLASIYTTVLILHNRDLLRVCYSSTFSLTRLFMKPDWERQPEVRGYSAHLRVMKDNHVSTSTGMCLLVGPAAHIEKVL